MFILKRKPIKTAVILALSIACLFGCIWTFRFGHLKSSATYLYEHPQPLPEYIDAIAPYPGTNVPRDPHSIPYWTGVYSEQGICIRLDASIVLNMISDGTVTLWDTEWALDQMPNDKVRLWIDGKFFDHKTWTDPNGNSQAAQVMILAAPVTIMGPGGEQQLGDSFVPINLCWRTSFSPGLHLAKIIVVSHGNKELQYQWAFKVERP